MYAFSDAYYRNGNFSFGRSEYANNFKPGDLKVDMFNLLPDTITTGLTVLLPMSEKVVCANVVVPKNIIYPYGVVTLVQT